MSIHGLSLLELCIFYPITSYLNVPCLRALGHSLANSTVLSVFTSGAIHDEACESEP